LVQVQRILASENWTRARGRVFNTASPDADGELRADQAAGDVAGVRLLDRISVNNPGPPHVSETELRLVERVARGDAAARREFFESYRDASYHVALRITGRAEDALDVVQDSFIRAFDRLAEFQRESSVRTWLLRIVTNRALDILRSRRVRLAVPLDSTDDTGGALPGLEAATESDPGQKLEAAELHDRLHRAVASLPPDQRVVFALYAQGEMTYAEIAEIVGIPIGTVMSRLYHARRRLRELLPDLLPAGQNRAE
jgi:RNA polymerase sigma-70 factor, ECF subfamily